MLFIAIGIALSVIAYGTFAFSFKLISLEKFDKYDYKIVLDEIRWFGLSTKRRTFVGNCTVFHDYDTGYMLGLEDGSRIIGAWVERYELKNRIGSIVDKKV